MTFPGGSERELTLVLIVGINSALELSYGFYATERFADVEESTSFTLTSATTGNQYDVLTHQRVGGCILVGVTVLGDTLALDPNDRIYMLLSRTETGTVAVHALV